MRLDPGRLSDCIEAQQDPEPFSGVVRLSRGDEVLFETARGPAVRSEAVPNTPGTRFQTASGCKIFTATAVCRLVERGAVAFDTKLADCVGDTFPNHDPGITLGQLLTHTSGITSYFEEDVSSDYEALWRDLPVYRVRRPRDFLPLFQDKPMKFPPGERFDYNDGGYILLGLAVESVIGKDFPACIAETVFEPADMDDSGYFPADRLPERTARGYIRDPDGTWRTNVFAVPAVGGPDGGAHTTAGDLDAFWRALAGNRLLGRAITDTLLEPRVATGLRPPHTHYGYGVWIDRPGTAVRKRFVEGSDPGVAMRSAFYPTDDVVLTVLGNTGSAVWPLWRKLEADLDL